MVVDEDHGQLDVLLDGGDEFLSHHQVRPVPYQDVDLAVRRRHFCSQAAGDLVPHAGVAVLDVVALRVTRPPQLVEVARHRPCGAHDDVTRCAYLVDHPDYFGLGRERLVPEPVGVLHRGVPFLGQSERLFPVRGVDGPAADSVR